MIRKIRKKLRLSQSQLAEMLSVTQGAISHYETGRRSLDKDIADALITVSRDLGYPVSYNDIFGDQSASQ